jgi:predicted DNA-binding antitoxin AbrB/MazE fold protein
MTRDEWIVKEGEKVHKEFNESMNSFDELKLFIKNNYDDLQKIFNLIRNKHARTKR